MNTKYLREVTDWFVLIKAPELKEEIEKGLKLIESDQPLEGNTKKLFGFMLFSFSMNHGPASFIGVELLAKKISLTEEFKEYAQNWINHSNKNKALVETKARNE